MLSETLLIELHNLKRTDKLRVVQLLVNELAQQEDEHDQVFTATQYEVWSPYDAPRAAQTLLDLLEQDKAQHDT